MCLVRLCEAAIILFTASLPETCPGLPQPRSLHLYHHHLAHPSISTPASAACRSLDDAVPSQPALKIPARIALAGLVRQPHRHFVRVLGLPVPPQACAVYLHSTLVHRTCNQVSGWRHRDYAAAV